MARATVAIIAAIIPKAYPCFIARGLPYGTDPRIVRGLLTRIVTATMQGKSCNEDALNFLVAFIKDGKPRDAREAVLLFHMACTDSLTMDTFRKMTNTEDPV